MSKDVVVKGYGQPAWGLFSDAVLACIREGNWGDLIDLRVSPRAWENGLMQIGTSRPVELERVENRAAVVTYICGRKVRVLADERIEGPDEVHYRSIAP